MPSPEFPHLLQEAGRISKEIASQGFELAGWPAEVRAQLWG